MRNQGFTLIEVLVVVGLFAVVAGLVVSASLHTHSGFTTKDDEDLAVATLEKARNQSMTGQCLGTTCFGAVAHGVHVTEGSLVLFQGASYNVNDSVNQTVFAQSSATNFNGSDIIFEPLSGDVNGTGTLFISDNGTTTVTITVGTQGQILWSN